LARKVFNLGAGVAVFGVVDFVVTIELGATREFCSVVTSDSVEPVAGIGGEAGGGDVSAVSGSGVSASLFVPATDEAGEFAITPVGFHRDRSRLRCGVASASLVLVCVEPSVPASGKV
jgi:hypothetical protein